MSTNSGGSSSSSTSGNQYTVSMDTMNKIVTFLEGIETDLINLYKNSDVDLYIPPLSVGGTSTSTSTSGSTATPATDTLLPGRTDAYIAAADLASYYGQTITSVGQLLSYVNEFLTNVKDAVYGATLDAVNGENQNTYDAAQIESLFSNVPGLGSGSAPSPSPSSSGT